MNMNIKSGNVLSETVYSPASQLQQPLVLFKKMWKDLLSSTHLAWRLFLRSFSARYRQTMFGYIWAFLPPLITTGIFVFLNSQKIFEVGETVLPYPAYVMISTLLWQVFVDAVNNPLQVVNQSKSFLTKINFPREAIIISGLYEVFFNFIIRLVLIVVVFLWFHIPLPKTIILAPLGVLSLVIFGLMVGILLVPLGMLYHDVENGLRLVISMWLFLTPVVYPPPTEGFAAFFSLLNPVTPLLVTTREMLTLGTMSQLPIFIIVSFVTLFMLFLGWVVFRLALPYLIEKLGN